MPSLCFSFLLENKQSPSPPKENKNDFISLAVRFRGGRAHFHSGSQRSAANDRSYLFCYFIYLFCVWRVRRERERERKRKEDFWYFLSILEKETRALMVPTENAIHPRGLCRRHLTPPPPISIHICTRLRWRKSFVNKSVTLVAELFLVWRRATTRTRQSTVDRADISGQGR